MNRVRVHFSAILFAWILGWSVTAAKVWASPLRSFDTVVIDAGHGGHDRGGVPGQYVTEKIVNLDVAARLRQKLREAGLKTTMTRSGDVFVGLGGRVAVANNRSRSIFVSVHFNSAPNVDARGIETYFYGAGSYPLAAAIHRRVVSLAAENRGVKRRGYYVLRNCRVPAVLVECGFLTNREDSRLALSSRYRDRLAEKIAEGILAARRN